MIDAYLAPPSPSEATISIRYPAASERPGLATLVSDVILGCDLYPHASRERMAESFRDLDAWVQHDPAFVIGAWADGDRVVGFALSDVNCGVCTLYWIGTHEEHRRSGVALALLQAVRAGLAARGAHRLIADVLVTNAPSRALMVKAGLRCAAHLPDHYDRLDWMVFTAAADREAEFPVAIDEVTRRLAPDCPTSVPWPAAAAHEEHAQYHHGTSLSELAKGGGLTPRELAAVICGASIGAAPYITPRDGIDLVRILDEARP